MILITDNSDSFLSEKSKNVVEFISLTDHYILNSKHKLTYASENFLLDLQ